MKRPKYVFYFDTSALNHLATDPAAGYISEQLSKNSIVWISAYVAAELLLTNDPAEREKLCRIATRLQMPFTPLATADQILKRSLFGLLEDREIIDVSLSDESDAVWHYVADNRNIDLDSLDRLRSEFSRLKADYDAFLYAGRTPMQKTLATARAKGERHSDGYAGWLLRGYILDEALVKEAVLQFLRQIQGAPTTDDVVRRILAELEVWRFYLIGIAHDVYSRAVQVDHFGRRSNTNWVDTQQTTYLRYCHVFVTNDKKQRRLVQYANLFGNFRRLVWTYDQLAGWIMRGCPRIEMLDRMPRDYLQPAQETPRG